MVSDEQLEVVREKAANGVCHLCDEPVRAHNGSHVTTQSFVAAIQDAITHANRHPSNTARNGELEYVVEDGYYPDDKCHYVDLSAVDPELRKSASINATSALAQRGLAVSSVQFDPPRLHVMAVDDMPFGYYGEVDEDG